MQRKGYFNAPKTVCMISIIKERYYRYLFNKNKRAQGTSDLSHV